MERAQLLAVCHRLHLSLEEVAVHIGVNIGSAARPKGGRVKKKLDGMA